MTQAVDISKEKTIIRLRIRGLHYVTTHVTANLKWNPLYSCRACEIQPGPGLLEMRLSIR
jgi:hypothetical protein